MSEYSGLERRVAKALEDHPRLRDTIRFAYKRLVYLRHRPDDRAVVPGGGHLVDVAERCGVRGADAAFFGYYDKSPWDPAGRHYLLHLRRGNSVEIAICDLEHGTHEVIGATAAWNLQQGAMAQWLSDDGAVAYNSYRDDTLGVEIHRRDEDSQFLPFPIQALHPGGGHYLSLNYRRLTVRRPDYGYPRACANLSADRAYADDGLWSVDLDDGTHRLLVSIEELRRAAPADYHSADHWVNHAMYSPSGDSAVFLHRWFADDGKHSRLYLVDTATGELRLLLDHRMISHYSWVDDEVLVTWARTDTHGDCYQLLHTADGSVERLDDGELTRLGDGHPSIDPTGRVLVTDTYPDKGRMQTLSTFDLESSDTVVVARLFAPWSFDEAERCDLHPRWHPFRAEVSVDSAHTGQRRNYILDVPAIARSVDRRP